MNSTKMPGFTAESSFYKASGQYHMAEASKITADGITGKATVVASLRSERGCAANCTCCANTGGEYCCGVCINQC